MTAPLSRDARYRARRAAEVARLTSENARFRAALEAIADGVTYLGENDGEGGVDIVDVQENETAETLAGIARQALEADGE